ncbi:Transposase (putative), YhgA-like protein [Candidatus Magnetomorum sp. HK-1]|nr:Transposase (putative), YhgA-like protein [Candidatus Magnetomorum sp. HK-1]
MPPDLVEKIDWDTLELEGSKYVDEELKDSESDLLYSVNFKDSKDKCFLYLLFEHQSKPDKWLRFRIMKYKTRIWDESFKKYKDQEVLIPILSGRIIKKGAFLKPCKGDTYQPRATPWVKTLQ